MDLFDFSSVELLDRVRMIGKVPWFYPPHRLYPSKLERPDIAHLYARWKFFLGVHRDSFLPTSAFRQ